MRFRHIIAGRGVGVLVCAMSCVFGVTSRPSTQLLCRLWELGLCGVNDFVLCMSLKLFFHASAMSLFYQPPPPTDLKSSNKKGRNCVHANSHTPSCSPLTLSSTSLSHFICLTSLFFKMFNRPQVIKQEGPQRAPQQGSAVLPVQHGQR